MTPREILNTDQVPKDEPQNERAPMTDSPFFWLYLFCTFGLIVLIVMMPKLEQRQQEVDLEGRGKRESIGISETDSTEEVSTNRPDAKERLSWLYPILAIILITSWTAYWVTQSRRGTQPSKVDSSKNPTKNEATEVRSKE